MKKLKIKPEIRKLKVSNVKPDPNNPRQISEEAFAGLTYSLERFGLVDLLVVNKRNMQIVSGHQRYEVLVAKGIQYTHCLMVDLTQDEQQQLAITLNNPKVMGEFTQEIIAVMEKIRQSDTEAYINLMIDKLREDLIEFEEEKTGNTLEDDIPTKGIKAITEPGDIWTMGEHRLMCGNSRTRAHVERLMDGEKAKLFATDPPYLVDYTGADRPNGGKDWSAKFKENQILDPEDFMRDFLSEGLRVCVNKAALYMWFAFKRYTMIRKIWDELKLLVHQQIVWVKPCSVLTFAIYPWKHEPCLFGWRQGKKPFFRVGQKSIGTVWELSVLRSGDPADPDYYSDIWHLNWEGKKRSGSFDHPTIKPVEVFAIPMRVHTKPGDVCYEPFCGSGSQIIAAEKLNRRCFAMELEMHFCDVAVKRWEDYTGKKAKVLKK